MSYAQELGYHVLAAINTDFFSTSTGVPLGIVIEDGVYKADSAGEAAMVISDGQVSLVENPEVTLTLTNERTDEVVTPFFFNRTRTEAGVGYEFTQSLIRADRVKLDIFLHKDGVSFTRSVDK